MAPNGPENRFHLKQNLMTLCHASTRRRQRENRSNTKTNRIRLSETPPPNECQGCIPPIHFLNRV